MTCPFSYWGRGKKEGLEKTASGRPVISSLDLKGNAPKIIYEAGCGLAVEPGNPQGLAGSVLKVYNNPELCKEMGIKSRKHAERELAFTVAAERYTRLIELIGVRGKAGKDAP